MILIHNQALPDEVFSIMTDDHIVGEPQRACVDVPQIGPIIQAWPWCFADNHLIIHQPDGPYITFGSIRVMFQQLRCHV